MDRGPDLEVQIPHFQWWTYIGDSWKFFSSFTAMSNEESEANVYDLDRPQLGHAIIVNNLHLEQPATRNDVASLENVLRKVKNPWSDSNVFLLKQNSF